MKNNESNNFINKKNLIWIIDNIVVIFIVWSGIILLAAGLYHFDAKRYTGANATDILNSGANLLTDMPFYCAIYCTLYLSLKGLFIGLICAGFFGTILGVYPELIPRFVPISNAIRAIPLTLLIPFLVTIPVFFPFPPGINEDKPFKDPAYLIALGTFLYILIGFAEGIARRDTEREKIVKKIFGFRRFKYFRTVLFFEVLPHVLTAVRLAILFAFVLAIVLEQLIQYPGIGKMISQKMADSNYNNKLEAEGLALLTIVAFVGIVVDRFYLLLRKKLVTWEKSN